jgi:collagen type III alpha
MVLRETSDMPATAQPAASSGYVDFDEYVEFQLEKTRNSIKWTDIATAAAGVAAFIVGYLLLFAVLDHWVVPGGFSRTARFIMAGLLAAVSGGWLAWKVLLPYLRRVSGLYAARTIELSEPGLKSTLLNLVDLRRAGREVPQEIRGALEKRAAQALSKMDVDLAVDRRPLMRSAYVLLGLVVLVCLYSIFSPKKISFARALLPPANVAPATRTTILDVRTNPPLTRTAEREVDVVARSHLEVVVDLSGEVPEEVTLRYTTADRKFVNEPVSMRPVEEGLKQYRGLLNGENGRGICRTCRSTSSPATTSATSTRCWSPSRRRPPSNRCGTTTRPTWSWKTARSPEGTSTPGKGPQSPSRRPSTSR